MQDNDLNVGYNAFTQIYNLFSKVNYHIFYDNTVSNFNVLHGSASTTTTSIQKSTTKSCMYIMI